ncbi:MAG: hypothetical protein KA330_09360 [Chitinophagaceae bacterium]|nr:hypothetical protein [Chitinophagaceae bacterium]MBP6416655.1 hypothetical protein [Chitinophagaceae bacterium]
MIRYQAKERRSFRERLLRFRVIVIYLTLQYGFLCGNILTIPLPEGLNDAVKNLFFIGQLPAGRLQTNNLWVSRVTASQHKEARIYTSLNGYRSDNFIPYLYVSDDYGTTLKQIGNGLPYEPINVVKEDPKDENILYVGTDGGLYVSFDAGASFMLWNGGLPKSVPVHDIAIQQRDNEIVLGTHGRSLFVAKLDDVQGLKKDPEWLKKKAAPKVD